jgi:hypothetical protein
MADRPVTDFPQPGDTRRVSLRTSNFKLFDLRYALDLKKNFPQIWAIVVPGGEPDEFEILMPIQRRGGSIRSDREELAVRRREAWAGRHVDETDLPAVIAQIKWLVVGTRGLAAMKTLVDAEKARIDRDQAGQASAHG